MTIVRVLIVASYNRNRFAPFILEQANALRDKGCEVFYYGLKGKGPIGYLRNLPGLIKRLKEVNPDLIHAHFGLTGLLANLQRRIPVITTYHGSDINDRKLLPFSRLSILLSAWNIFVSDTILSAVKPRRCFSVIPCGIELNHLQLTNKESARMHMNLEKGKTYILFSGSFDRREKNAPLAKEVIKHMKGSEVELLELSGYSRDEVILLMCGVDALLLTSFSEGSPQVIKEAMACGCPIVSVDVGDVRERLSGIAGCFVSDSYDPVVLAGYVNEAIEFRGKTNGRERIISNKLDNSTIASILIGVYRRVLSIQE